VLLHVLLFQITSRLDLNDNVLTFCLIYLDLDLDSD